MQDIAADDTAILWRNKLSGDLKLTDEQATSIYRIVQESLTNALKHSQADHVTVTAQRDDGILEVRIEDNGIGMSEQGGLWGGVHYGLLGMKERAAMIGAEMSIVASPGSGTAILVRVRA